MKNGNMPAAPTIASLNRKEDKFLETQVDNDDFMLFGLTKREHLAAMAIQGMIACEYGAKVSATQWARDAVEVADALLEELEKSE